MKKYAVILAAGTGHRLKPITNIMPKSLIRVAGHEILNYQIHGYLSSGIKEEDIMIVTGYMAEKISSFLDDKYPKVRRVYNENYSTTNNMYSLYLALRIIKEETKFNLDTICVNNADCLYDNVLMKEFINSKHKNSIATEEGVFIEESMKVTISDTGNITNIAKNISKTDAMGVSIDLYKYDQDAVKELYNILCNFIEINGDLKQWTEVAFPYLFKTIHVFPFYIGSKKWMEVDNMEDLLLADKLFSSFNIFSKKAIICDLDGTLFIGNAPIKPAIDFVNKNFNNFKFYYLTNNTSKIPSEYVCKLSSMGLKITENQIISPLFTLINYIRKKKFKVVYLVATNTVKKYICEKMPHIDFEYSGNNSECEAIILTYDTEVNFEKFKNISVILNNNKNVEYIVTHTDMYCPTEMGNIPDIGSYIELIFQTTGKKPSLVLGKPSVNLIEQIIEKYSCEKLVIIGDRLYTDKLLANNANIDFVCVLSGDTSRYDIAMDTTEFPKVILDNLGELEMQIQH